LSNLRETRTVGYPKPCRGVLNSLLTCPNQPGWLGRFGGRQFPAETIRVAVLAQHDRGRESHRVRLSRIAVLSMSIRIAEQIDISALNSLITCHGHRIANSERQCDLADRINSHMRGRSRPVTVNKFPIGAKNAEEIT